MANVCFNNARELARRGHDVTVYTIDYDCPSDHQDPKEFRIVRLGSPFIYGAGGVFPQLYLKLKHVELIHLHYPFFGGAEYVYLAALLRKQRYFLTYHCDAFGDSPLRSWIIRLYEATLLRPIISRAGMIGALTREHLESSKIASIVDWSRVIEVPNGVDTDLFQPRQKDAALVDQYHLEGKKVILFAGRLQSCKGLEVLIDALFLLKDEQTVLLVVGGGYTDTEYRKQAKEKGMQDRVIFVGPVPHDELSRYYNLCDFLVLPSTYMEAFPLVVLEALASGKPAIVSSLPGPSQLIRDGIDGLVSRVGDREDLCEKIAYLCKSPDRRREMGAAGREKVMQKYEWREIGARLEDIFRHILSS
jgi:glycosyltransferase involved in cell wall biosynthesis